MAHIIVKTGKSPDNDAPQGLAAAARSAIVIDFSEKKKAVPASFFISLFAVFCSFVSVTIIAAILISAQAGGMGRYFIPDPDNGDAPLLAAESSLPPLRGRTPILGRDFQRGKTGSVKTMTEAELIPILEKLPLYDVAPSPRKNGKAGHKGLTIEVDDGKDIASYQREADTAYAEGNLDKAVKAARKALALDPANHALKRNLVALYLEEAQGFENAEEWKSARAAYATALSVFEGASSTAAAIRARRDYAGQKAEE